MTAVPQPPVAAGAEGIARLVDEINALHRQLDQIILSSRNAPGWGFNGHIPDPQKWERFNALQAEYWKKAGMFHSLVGPPPARKHP